MQYVIFSVDNLDEPLHYESPDENTDQNISKTKQILFLNHQKTLCDNVDKIVFVMICQQVHMHLCYDFNIGECGEIVTYKLQKAFDRMLDPLIRIDSLNLQYYDKNNEFQTIQQDFFISNRNQIQLVYPNYHDKSSKYRNIQLIQKAIGHEQLDHQSSKLIVCLDFLQPEGATTSRQIQSIACL